MALRSVGFQDSLMAVREAEPGKGGHYLLKKFLNQGVRSMREKRIKSLKLPEPDNLVPRVRGPGHRYIQEQTAELLAGSSGLGEVSPWDPRAGDGGQMSTHTSPSFGSSPAVSSWWARPGEGSGLWEEGRGKGRPGTAPRGTQDGTSWRAQGHWQWVP